MSESLLDLAAQEVIALYNLEGHFLCTAENLACVKRMIAGDTTHVVKEKAWLYELVNNRRTGA